METLTYELLTYCLDIGSVFEDLFSRLKGNMINRLLSWHK